MRPILFFLLFFTATSLFAQDKPCEISAPVDLPLDGWNKVLLMRNGNTVLLHMEHNKPLVIKVFGKDRKEIASQKYPCDVLDINTLDMAVFKGFYDINGEAVLFMQQPNERKESLIRITFDANSGKMLSEKLMLQSASFNKRTDYYVLKSANVDSYAVFCFRSTIWHPDTQPELCYFNEKHEQYKSIPINIDVTNFKWMDFVGANLDAYGNICITIYLSNRDVSSASLRTAFDNQPSTFNKYLALIYVPKGSDKFIGTSVKLASEIAPDYTNFSYDPFSHGLNVLLLETQNQLVKNGLNTVSVNNRHSLLLTVDGDMSLKYNWINYTGAKNIAYPNDSTKIFDAIPIKMYTATNGLTTLVSEEYGRYDVAETRFIKPETETGDIAVTRLDDTGRELSTVVIPKAQFVQANLYPYELSHRDVSKSLFVKAPGSDVYSESFSRRRGSANTFFRGPYRDIAQNDFVNEFTSVNSYPIGKSLYLVYNDDKKDFSATTTPVDSVYDFTYTDGIYCVVNHKNEVTKHYLFGAPGNDESKSSAIESACFDDKTHTYATLMLDRKGDKVTSHLAWCHLE